MKLTDKILNEKLSSAMIIEIKNNNHGKLKFINTNIDADIDLRKSFSKPKNQFLL